MVLERRVTMALLLAFVLESAGVFLWAGAAAERLRVLESGFEERGSFGERMVRIETELVSIRRQLDRVEKHLESMRVSSQ